MLSPAILALVAASAVSYQGFGTKATPEQKKAQAAYDALQEKLAKAKSIKLVLEVNNLDRMDTYELSFLRDNYAKVVSKEVGIYQNGKTYYDYSILDKEYWTQNAPAKGLPRGTAFSLGGVIGLEAIGFSNEPRIWAVGIASKKWMGVDARAIEIRGEMDKNFKGTLYVDPKSGLPMGWSFSLQDYKSSGKFKSIVLDPPMKPANFAWQPPAGAKKIG